MTSADFTIADVLMWARTKPADEWYDYESSSACAMCQFLLETARTPNPTVGPGYWDDRIEGGCVTFPEGLEDAVIDSCVAFEDGNHDWTFGNLVRRLEALCPETSVNANNWQSIDAYLTDIEDVARERVSA